VKKLTDEERAWVEQTLGVAQQHQHTLAKLKEESDEDRKGLLSEVERLRRSTDLVEERLVVTDLCDLLAFEKDERVKRRLRRAINFIEGYDCFPHLLVDKVET
jgi:hypothetical protein